MCESSIGGLWRRFNDGENDCVHECSVSQCVNVWEEWKKWQSEPPQQTDFPHKTACPKSDTCPHETT
jgi:hypothetical protein